MGERIHFIGVGGVSMSTLAAIAAKRGDTVTGSDRAPSEATGRLERAGVKVFYPQAAENIGEIDRAVYTAAISEDNPEMVEVRKRGVPLLRRSQYLGEIMRAYPVRIGVSGTHGKSSTTGMIGQIFLAAGRDPTIACGAVLKEQDSAYLLGSGEHFIYEACEYKDSFLDFFPSIAVILNIEMDHVDYYHSMAQMENSYLRSTSSAGAIVANFDDPHVRAVCAKADGAWVVRVGVNAPDADYRAKNIRTERGFSSFDLYKENEFLCRVSLSVPGAHHIGNALCAAAAAHLCGISGEEIAAGLSSYKGVKRRFEYIGDFRGARVCDDYAHHPTEIAVTLKTAREMLGPGRLYCVFQPHTYSRTAGLFDEFVSALGSPDKLILLPIYAAREENIYGVSSEKLAEKLPNARTAATFAEAAALLENELRAGDLLLTLGAGQANIVGQMLLGTNE